MNKIEVLRSDKSVKNILSKISDSIDVDNTKISDLFTELNIKNIDLEKLTIEKASENPKETALRTISTKRICKTIPPVNEVLSLDYIKNNVKNNKSLENNYYDPVRGNVIKIERHNGLYSQEFDIDDLQAIRNNTFKVNNSKAEYKHIFLRTDAIDYNKITNCFSGKDLSNGATLSFWVCYNNKYRIEDRGYGLFAFIGDYEKHYFDEEGEKTDSEYTMKNTFLSCSTSFDFRYEEAFRNNYLLTHNFEDNKFYKKIIQRANKNWMHISVSFTNEGIVLYMNGTKVNAFKETKGKRFNTGKGAYNQTDFRYRVPILDFLADENTSLFLGVTLDNDKISEAMLFDDVAFYDKSIDSDKEAMDIYQEALTINLP